MHRSVRSGGNSAMSASSVSSSNPPPFYWKVPVEQKDYMSENVKKMRQIQNQQKKKVQPLKATFIPGVTKNPKYDHVRSRFSDIISVGSQRGLDSENTTIKSHLTSLASLNSKNSKATQSQSQDGPLRRSESGPMNAGSTKAIWGASEAANARRLARSSSDLSRGKSTSASMAGGDQPKKPYFVRRQKSLVPQNESVYNWRFSDVNNSNGPRNFGGSNTNDNIHHHKVEYLPCDGICAEETVVVDNVQPPASGRSTSSSLSLTSRGINTEETRIFKNGKLKDPTPSYPENESFENGHEDGNSKGRKTRSVFTMKQSHQPPLESDPFEHDVHSYYKGQNGHEESRRALIDSMSNLKLKDTTGQKSVSSVTLNGIPSEAPHPLGTVPKYLKQRKEEWKQEALAKREAEKNADIPPGHSILTESERKENHDILKMRYDELINQLNRFPIRIDTVRSRNQKIELEQQLTKLEEAMKSLSRQRVIIRNDI